MGLGLGILCFPALFSLFWNHLQKMNNTVFPTYFREILSSLCPEFAIATVEAATHIGFVDRGEVPRPAEHDIE